MLIQNVLFAQKIIPKKIGILKEVSNLATKQNENGEEVFLNN